MADSESLQKTVKRKYFSFFDIPIGTLSKLRSKVKIRSKLFICLKSVFFWPLTLILTMFQLEFWKKKGTFNWQFFARISNLQSELQNSHFENLTLYDLWPQSGSIKNNFEKFLWPDSDSTMTKLPESPRRWVPFQWTVFFWEVYYISR